MEKKKFPKWIIIIYEFWSKVSLLQKMCHSFEHATYCMVNGKQLKFKPNVDLMLGFIMPGNKSILTIYLFVQLIESRLCHTFSQHQWLLGFGYDAQLVRKLLSTEFLKLHVLNTRYSYRTIEQWN